MLNATRAINHNNALVTPEEKSYVVRTLQELVRAGYDFDMRGAATTWANEAEQG